MKDNETNGQMWERLGIRLPPDRGGASGKDKKAKKREKRDLPGELFAQVAKAGLPLPIREHVFHPERQWRLDLAWPDLMIAVECHGGIWVGGRHTRGVGYTEDRAKMNEAVTLGWKIVEVTADQIDAGLALGWITHAISIHSHTRYLNND